MFVNERRPDPFHGRRFLTLLLQHMTAHGRRPARHFAREPRGCTARYPAGSTRDFPYDQRTSLSRLPRCLPCLGEPHLKAQVENTLQKCSVGFYPSWEKRVKRARTRGDRREPAPNYTESKMKRATTGNLLHGPGPTSPEMDPTRVRARRARACSRTSHRKRCRPFRAPCPRLACGGINGTWRG